MASSQKLTEYERRRLENIRRNEEIMAALRIYSKATQLFSTSSKRQRAEAKSKNLSPEEEKPETQTRRSLRTQGMRPEFSDPNLNDLV
ncbi:hypothetical protein RGQ29_021479 [Quercus rubra]|uniref:Uncharacterized protein n=1 Tax=Quercus rubra TaxID=3512 RepID=A0AAN7FEU3_QUERU|nr:hypothetical protein RGQ29_021479 [Quercus rubra]